MGNVEALLRDARARERTAPEHALALAREAFEAARALPRGPDRRTLEATAALQAARCCLMQRDADEALRWVTTGHARARQTRAPSLVARLLESEGAAFSALGHLPAALEAFDEGLRVARALADDDVRGSLEMNRAAALRRHGHLEDAAAAYDQLLERDTPDTPPELRIVIRQNASSTYWQIGRADEAWQRLAEARVIEEREALHALDDWQDALEAWVALAQGRLEVALAAGERLAGRAWGEGDAAAIESGRRAQARTLASGIRGDEGRARAAAILRELVAHATRTNRWADLGTLHEELADVLATQGRPDEALVEARAALAAEREAHRNLREVMARAETRRLEMALLEIEARQLRTHNQELAELTKRLERVSDERARLLATVAHDLRTPLTALGCSLDLYRSVPSQLEHLIQTVGESVELMQALIDEALAVDAIRTGRVPVHLRRVDLVAALRRLVAGLAPLADRKEIVIRVSSPERLPWSTDPTAFARIVENVVSNALKYSPPRSTVGLTLTRREGEVEFSARDQGPGFGEGDLEGLFEAGRTGPARPTMGESSSGIGLHVVADLARALGGTVVATNAPDRGAIVRVRFPVPSEPPAESAA